MFDPDKQWPKLRSFSWQEKLALGVFLVGLTISIGGLVLIWYHSNTAVHAVENTQIISSGHSQAMITIDIGGAVQKPGVYQLSQPARITHAVEKAGGFRTDADTYYLTQNLNLSKSLTDEEKIYIPFKGEMTSQQSAAQTANTNSTQISINTATISELETLPEVGEKRAEEIIAARPYATLAELVSKEVVSESLFQKIEKLIKL